MRRFAGLSALVCVLFFQLTGCAYLQDRGDDAREIIDAGISISQKPQFAFYASGPIVQIAALGVGNVDGKFVGLGEGEWRNNAPHYEKSIGLFLWGEEWISYKYSKADLEAMPRQEADEAANFMRVGVAGMLQGPPPDKEYIVSCPHYIHLGFVGLVATPRYLQFADFLLGWTTLDILNDDGEKDQARQAMPETKPARKSKYRKHEGLFERD